MIQLSHFNLEPNREWYFRVEAGASETSVELYTFYDDAQNQTNLVASNDSVSFGVNIPVTLTQAGGAPETISFFQSEIDYHLTVTSAANEGVKIFKLNPFTDLPPIGHSIYKNFELAQRRAEVEIGKHANAQFSFTVNLGLCTPWVNPLDEVLIQSDFFGLAGATVQVLTHRISGNQRSLTSDLTCIMYKPIVMD